MDRMRFKTVHLSPLVTMNCSDYLALLQTGLTGRTVVVSTGSLSVLDLLDYWTKPSVTISCTEFLALLQTGVTGRTVMVAWVCSDFKTMQRNTITNNSTGSFLMISLFLISLFNCSQTFIISLTITQMLKVSNTSCINFRDNYFLFFHAFRCFNVSLIDCVPSFINGGLKERRLSMLRYKQDW